jgi:hypothetical protein
MQRRNLGVLLVVVVVAVVGFVIASGSGDDKKKSSSGGTTASKPAAIEVTVKNGKPLGGIQHLTYSKGDRVRMVVRSDVADEVHVHGYDLMKDVRAGGSVEFDFPAKIDGKFEIELEGRKEQIADLAVSP